MIVDICLIVKNEEINIKKLIEQLILFSHEIHITDTGSTDNTLKIIQELQENYPNIYIHHYMWDMDFSKAKNYSLSCYNTDNTDYQFWCDSDDLLNDKLIESLQEFSNNQTYDEDIYYIKYQYFFGDTNPHIRTSLLKVSSHLRWNDPIHEYIALRENLRLNLTLFDNGSLILHQHTLEDLSTKKNSFLRNLTMFFNMEKTNFKFNARNRYYYGNELLNAGIIESGICQLHKCIDDFITNDAEKIFAVASLFENNDPLAIDYLFKIMKNGMCRKDLLYYLGNYYFDKSNFELAKTYYKNCLEYPEPDDFLKFGYNPSCIINSLLQLGLIYFNIGDYQSSLKYNNMILDIEPDNSTAINNIDILSTNYIK